MVGRRGSAWLGVDRNRIKRQVGRAVWQLERAAGARDLDRAVETGQAVLGRHSYGEPRIYVYGDGETKLRIGNFTSIARGATFLLGGNHRVDTVTTFPLARVFNLAAAGLDGQPWSKGDIVVGSDVWIAAHALIMSGVVVGNGAVVAAGATVTRDVRPFAVVAGNPAREIRRRFPDEQCAALEELAWWEWDDQLIIDSYEALASPDITAFIERHRANATHRRKRS